MIEYFMTNMWQAWIILMVACLILELVSGGDCYIICFSLGALVAAVVSPFFGIYVQLVAFLIVSLVCVFQFRPFAVRWLHRGEDKRVSNADAIIGRVGIVSETIAEGGFGRVAIDGDDWKAQAVEGTVGDIAKGKKVRVVGRESIILEIERA